MKRANLLLSHLSGLFRSMNVALTVRKFGFEMVAQWLLNINPKIEGEGSNPTTGTRRERQNGEKTALKSCSYR